MHTLKTNIIACFICLLLGLASTIHAQDNYHISGGIRAGTITGLSYKQFLGVPTAIEVFAGFDFENTRLISLAGFYQYHIPLNYQLNVYGGAGVGIRVKDRFKLLGEAMIGLEYTMPKFPVNFSFDYKPSYDIFNNGFFFDEFGVSLRYIFD